MSKNVPKTLFLKICVFTDLKKGISKVEIQSQPEKLLFDRCFFGGGEGKVQILEE